MFSAFILAFAKAILIAEYLAFSSLVLLKEGSQKLAVSNANKPYPKKQNRSLPLETEEKGTSGSYYFMKSEYFFILRMKKE